VIPEVTVKVVIGASVALFPAGALHVRLEDTSYADAAAQLVAEAMVPGVRHNPAGQPDGATVVTVKLTTSAAIDPEHDYSVRVWLDRDGDGQPGSGDLWSDETHRVLTRGFGIEVTVILGE
jgi:hypothetical protein